MTWREQLDADGYTIIPNALSTEAVAAALAEWDAVTHAHAADEALLSGGSGPAYGARNLLDLWPSVVDLVRVPPLSDVLRDVLGAGAGVVRVLYFDKPPGHSWALPWHKDYSIAVKEFGPASLFTKPTVKAGVPHLVAPRELLDGMLTVRIHLDAATADNGPLRVIPGSHVAYTQKDDPQREAETLFCPAGGTILMRPLVTHASGHSKSDAGLHRRTVHLECAPLGELPDGYEWKWFVPVARNPSPGPLPAERG